jgi:hypothetical protein
MSFKLIILKQPDHFPVSKIAIKSIITRRKQATNITCNGEANGTATVTVSGGIYTYTGVMEPMLVLLRIRSGQYDVVVTDVLNNKVTANFTITEPTLITIPQQNLLFIMDMLVNACNHTFSR